MTGKRRLCAGFIGAWILIPESCAYEQGDPPRQGTYRIDEADGGALEFEITWTDSGGEEHAVRFSGVPDGAAAPFAGGELADAISVSAVSARELTTRAYWRGEERMVAQRQLDQRGVAMRVTQLIRFDDGSTQGQYERLPQAVDQLSEETTAVRAARSTGPCRSPSPPCRVSRWRR